jgi:two-component system, LytTR family, sensor kinase
MNKNLIFRIFGTPFIALLFYIVFFDYNSDNEVYQVTSAKYGWRIIFLDLTVYFLGAIAISEISLFIRKYLEKYFSWEKHPFILGFGRILTVATITIFFIYQIDIIYCKIFEGTFYYPFSPTKISFYQTISLGVLVALILTGYDTAFYFFDRWNKTQLETETLNRLAIQGQLDALRMQLDPHFLFNNFNTLTTIIEEDPKLAISYVEKLSQVYRYVLQSRSEDTITLRKELSFIESYLFLAKTRFEENLIIDIQVAENQKDRHIPPVALQLLCENAIKHNIVSKQKPLTIKIFSTDKNELWISNNLQLKSSVEHSTKIGLQNINKRYLLLGKAEPAIVKNEYEFIIKLPLI